LSQTHVAFSSFDSAMRLYRNEYRDSVLDDVIRKNPCLSEITWYSY